METIEELNEFLLHSPTRVIFESDGNGGINIEIVDIGGREARQLWIAYCAPAPDCDLDLELEIALAFAECER